jgi:hypothetical protein
MSSDYKPNLSEVGNHVPVPTSNDSLQRTSHGPGFNDQFVITVQAQYT